MKVPPGLRDRPKAVLQGLLQALGGRVFRTKLINLSYLIDEANYRFRGETVTGLSYWWEHCGVNSVDNEIVRLLEELVDDGLVTMTVHSMPQGGEAYGYQTTDRSDRSSISLSSDDWIEIQTAVHKYSGMTTAQIVKESKSTAPMQKRRSAIRAIESPTGPLTYTDG